MTMQDKPSILKLSDQQLEAYNRRDIDGFCACYHDDVVVLDEMGKVTIEGIQDFRERYGSLFVSFQTRAWITERICLGNHVVEKEEWHRRSLETGEVTSGQVIVRYTEREGRLAIVEFLR